MTVETELEPGLRILALWLPNPFRCKCMNCRRGVIVKESKHGRLDIKRRCPVCHKPVLVRQP